MPELPEVETVARTLFPHIHNCVFLDATVLRDSCVHPASLPFSMLYGMGIANVRRRAKLIIMDLEPVPAILSDIGRQTLDMADQNQYPPYLVIHLRMTGRIFTRAANEAQGKHTRCFFSLQNPAGNRFNLFFDDTRAFGKILLANDAILRNWDFWRNLGPEPLALDAAGFATRLKGKRTIKACLLDQKVIAGIGNIYADEALFKSGIRPSRQADSLNKRERARLLAALQAVLRLSISQCGSSIRDYRDADGNVGSFQNSFSVYGRGGEKCKKCGSILHKERIGGRATVFCEVCQK